MGTSSHVNTLLKIQLLRQAEKGLCDSISAQYMSARTHPNIYNRFRVDPNVEYFSERIHSRLDPLLPSHLCIPSRALELQPFSLKPLLRRATAYDSLERYRKAYVDYKTVLQIDISVQAANDSVNRYYPHLPREHREPGGVLTFI